MSEPTMNLAAVNERRSLTPELVAQGWASRSRRPLLPEDGKLVIIAADHGARGALGVRGDAKAMATRSDLLHRLTVSLSRPGVDGVLATPDVLEDLLLLGELENKVAIGSMNRGDCRVRASNSTTGSRHTPRLTSPAGESRAARC